jgi:hypothetical protein
MMLVFAGEHWKPAGRAANYGVILVMGQRSDCEMTYALSLACANVVGKTVAVVWVAHEDGGLDGLEGIASECGSGATADGVVHDLTTLKTVRNCFDDDCVSMTYLRVTNEDNLCAGALLVVGSDGLDDSSGSLGG